MFENIRKRDGRIAPFDAERITSAIAKAGQATGEFDRETAKNIRGINIETGDPIDEGTGLQ